MLWQWVSIRKRQYNHLYRQQQANILTVDVDDLS
jgi:hypothetical protein